MQKKLKLIAVILLSVIAAVSAASCKSSNSSAQNGTISFYSESVNMDKLTQQISKQTFELETEQVQNLSDILSGAEWTPTYALDMMMLSYDGEIALPDMDKICFPDLEENIIVEGDEICYFGFKDNVLYYKNHIASFSGKQAKYIKSLAPILLRMKKGW